MTLDISHTLRKWSFGYRYALARIVLMFPKSSMNSIISRVISTLQGVDGEASDVLRITVSMPNGEVCTLGAAISDGQRVSVFINCKR